MALAIAPDSRLGISFDEFDQVDGFSLREFPSLMVKKHVAPPAPWQGGCGDISPNGRFATYSPGAGIWFCRVPQGGAVEQVRLVPVEEEQQFPRDYFSLQLASNRHLITRYQIRGGDGTTTMVWDLKGIDDPRELTVFEKRQAEGHEGSDRLHMSCDRSIVYAFTDNPAFPGRVDFVDWRTGSCLLTLHQPNSKSKAGKFTSVALLPDNQTLLTAHFDGSIRVRAFPSGKELHSFQVARDHSTRIAVSPDGRLVAVVIDEEIKVFHAKTVLKK